MSTRLGSLVHTDSVRTAGWVGCALVHLAAVALADAVGDLTLADDGLHHGNLAVVECAHKHRSEAWTEGADATQGTQPTLPMNDDPLSVSASLKGASDASHLLLEEREMVELHLPLARPLLNPQHDELLLGLLHLLQEVRGGRLAAAGSQNTSAPRRHCWRCPCAARLPSER